MEHQQLLLDAAEVIEVLQPLRRVNQALLELLRGVGPEDWRRPTIHANRDVKDLAAHLVHGSLRRVTALRDGYHRPGPALASMAELIEYIQQDNRAFISGMRRVSRGSSSSWRRSTIRSCWS